MVIRVATHRLLVLLPVLWTACAVRDERHVNNSGAVAATAASGGCSSIPGGTSRNNPFNAMTGKSCKCDDRLDLLKGDDCGDLLNERYFEKTDANSLQGKRCKCERAACEVVSEYIAGVKYVTNSVFFCECPEQVPFQCVGGGDLQEISQRFYYEGTVIGPRSVVTSNIPKGLCTCKKPPQVAVNDLEPDVTCGSMIDGATTDRTKPGKCVCPKAQYLIGEDDACKKYHGRYIFPPDELAGKGCKCETLTCDDLVYGAQNFKRGKLPSDLKGAWNRKEQEQGKLFYNCKCSSGWDMHPWISEKTGFTGEASKLFPIIGGTPFFLLGRAVAAGCTKELCRCHEPGLSMPSSK